MPLTIRQAKELYIGQVLYHVRHRNADGSPQRWKVNGRVKTWKRDPDRVEVPMKHGMKTCDYLTEKILDELCLTESEAVGALVRPDFDWTCECGFWQCKECGIPLYPMEVEEHEEDKERGYPLCGEENCGGRLVWTSTKK